MRNPARYAPGVPRDARQVVAAAAAAAHLAAAGPAEATIYGAADQEESVDARPYFPRLSLASGIAGKALDVNHDEWRPVTLLAAPTRTGATSFLFAEMAQQAEDRGMFVVCLDSTMTDDGAAGFKQEIVRAKDRLDAAESQTTAFKLRSFLKQMSPKAAGVLAATAVGGIAGVFITPAAGVAAGAIAGGTAGWVQAFIETAFDRSEEEARLKSSREDANRRLYAHLKAAAAGRPIAVLVDDLDQLVDSRQGLIQLARLTSILEAATLEGQEFHLVGAGHSPGTFNALCAPGAPFDQAGALRMLPAMSESDVSTMHHWLCTVSESKEILPADPDEAAELLRRAIDLIEGRPGDLCALLATAARMCARRDEAVDGSSGTWQPGIPADATGAEVFLALCEQSAARAQSKRTVSYRMLPVSRRLLLGQLAQMEAVDGYFAVPRLAQWHEYAALSDDRSHEARIDYDVGFGDLLQKKLVRVVADDLYAITDWDQAAMALDLWTKRQVEAEDTDGHTDDFNDRPRYG